jgi:predicted enzyme related to lactoylglutathione lyase
MFNKLRTVIYHVNDIDAAKVWYKKVTGIDAYFDEPFYVGFDINGFELGLHPAHENMQQGNHTTSYWSVDDIQASFEKLISLGATEIENVRDVGGGIKVATVQDPFGNYIGLINGA